MWSWHAEETGKWPGPRERHLDLVLGTHVGTSMRQRSVGLVRNISQLEATLELTARLLLGHYYANWTLRS